MALSTKCNLAPVTLSLGFLRRVPDERLTHLVLDLLFLLLQGLESLRIVLDDELSV